MNAKELRQFGFLFGGFVVAIFGLIFPLLKGRPLPWWPWMVALPFWTLALAAPKSLEPFYRQWMKFGHFMGRVNSTILLTLVYFLLFLPVGIVRRLRGRDPLRLKWDKAAGTYREPSKVIPPANMEEIF